MGDTAYKRILYDGYKVQTDSAIRDGRGQQISSTYIKGMTASGGDITYTRGDDTTGTISVSETLYSAGPGITQTGTVFSETFPIYYTTPNQTSQTATLTATISNFPSSYRDGIMIAIRLPFNNAESSTLNVNGLGAKPVYYANTDTSSGRWALSGCVALLVYETKTTSSGCWKAVYSYKGVF